MAGAFTIERALGWGSDGSHSRMFSAYAWTKSVSLVFYTCKKSEWVISNLGFWFVFLVSPYLFLNYVKLKKPLR